MGDTHEFLMLRDDVVQISGRGLVGKPSPKDLHVAFVSIANIAPDIYVQTSEIGSGIEKLNEVFATEDMALGQWLVIAKERSQGPGCGAGFPDLPKEAAGTCELVRSIRQRKAGGCLVVFGNEINPVNLGASGIVELTGAVAAAEALDQGR
jgi:hypothetical protein